MFRALTKVIPRRGALPRLWFSTEPKAEVTEGQSKGAVSNILKEEEKKFLNPVYERPYDKAKYEVPSTKIKVNSGFALMEIEPFPRARIMKICYHILERIRQIPEEAMYRQYTEEKAKCIMTVVDETEDIQQLERNLGAETIEQFIEMLAEELELIDYYKKSKPWVKVPISKVSLEMLRSFDVPDKNPRYQRDPRLAHKFLDAEKKPQS